MVSNYSNFMRKTNSEHISPKFRKINLNNHEFNMNLVLFKLSIEHALIFLTVYHIKSFFAVWPFYVLNLHWIIWSSFYTKIKQLQNEQYVQGETVVNSAAEQKKKAFFKTNQCQEIAFKNFIYWASIIRIIHIEK